MDASMGLVGGFAGLCLPLTEWAAWSHSDQGEQGSLNIAGLALSVSATEAEDESMTRDRDTS